MSSPLDWPREWARDRSDRPVWFHAGSNLSLDFHGDPAAARLAVFSDGNHHMALAEALQAFLAGQPAVRDIFYATTPPAVLVQALTAGGFSLGNLFLSVRPHVFISPAPVLDALVATGQVAEHVPFMRSRGNVMLVRAGNPLGIASARDLARPEVRLFLSNPQTEKASYEVYAETLARFARAFGVSFDFLAGPAARIVYGERIHHREAPQALHDDRADAAVLYYHLALRYTRIFPGCFEIVALDGEGKAEPATRTDNIVTAYHLGLVGDGGEWGARLRDFLMTDTVTAVYRRHGLERPDA
ncbi:MAG: substrate-binding domain-containing protein [Pseudomonadota bacterium]